jgi:DNA repair protein RadA/Sms
MAIFVCEECSASYAKWQGKCDECEGWNCLQEKGDITQNKQLKINTKASTPTITPLSSIEISKTQRFSSGIAEFDRVLGGGFVKGSVILLGGQPGAGKSTLILQILANIAHSSNTIYISGEESVEQIALRAKRMNLSDSPLPIVSETNIDSIAVMLNHKNIKLVAIDSIQMMNKDTINSPSGSINQVRTCTNILIDIAKKNDICILLIGHVTKEGSLAGPKVLEHCVDCSILLEAMTDSRYRALRSQKNRYGASNELGIFAMTDTGMKQVSNPSAIFLSNNDEKSSGRVITITKEGSLPLLIELQTLVNNTSSSNRLVSIGIDSTRVAMLLAICEKHTGVSFAGCDIFINIVSGIKVTETSTDLALIAALVSSLTNKPIANDIVIFGEVGLSGEIRPVPFGQERVKEAIKHGFKTIYLPTKNATKEKNATLKKVDKVSVFLEELGIS